MLPRKVITKKQKKEARKKRLGLALISLGLFAVASFLFYVVFLDKPDPIISPLSKDQTTQVSKIQKLLSEKRIEYEEVGTNKDLNYVIRLTSDQEAIIDPNKNIEEQLSSLQLVLRQLKIEGKTFRRLDFRYQKPVITF